MEEKNNKKTTAKSGVKKTAETAKSGTKAAANSVKSGTKTAAKTVKSETKTAANSAKSGTKAAAKTVKSGTKSTASSVKKGTKTAASSAKSGTKTAAKTVKKGAKTALETAKSGAEKVAKTAKKMDKAVKADDVSMGSKLSEAVNCTTCEVKKNLEQMQERNKQNDENSRCTFLNNIWKNLETATSSIDLILPKVSDVELRNTLSEQKKSYFEVSQTISCEIAKCGKVPKSNNLLRKATMWSNIQVNTLLDSRPGHLADMMIQGTNMGIISLNKEKNAHENLDKETKKYADDLISLYESNIKGLNQYL